MDEYIDVPLKLDNDVALELALFAHDTHRTMSDLVIDILKDSARNWGREHAPVRQSRNAREGDYKGRHQGMNYRSIRRWLRLVRDVGFLEHRHLYGIRRKRHG